MRSLPGKFFPKNVVYTNLSGSLESCKSTCEKALQCIAYSFEKAQRCTLFSETGEYRPKAGVDSGLKVQQP